MNDLNGLDWSAKPSNGQNPNYNASSFATLRPTPPGSGRISPLPKPTSPAPNIKSPTSATDSFSNLVSFGSSNANKNLSLKEQQKKLAESKAQQLTGGVKSPFAQAGGSDDKFWNSLESRSSTPQTQDVGKQADDEDDFLAAFNKPQMQKPKDDRKTHIVTQATLPLASAMIENDDDDDPFGLSEFQAKQKTAAQHQTQPPVTKDIDEDDVLGLLGKPLSEQPPKQVESRKVATPVADPFAKAVAELVDMGFPHEKASKALQSTESGVDVQAAVGWLLTQAHSETRDRSRGQQSDSRAQSRHAGSRTREDSVPTRDSRSGTPSNDPAKMASDIGNNFMKSAGSFWKQAKKQAQQAMQDFNSDSDSSQPKWMRNPQSEVKDVPAERPQARRRRSSAGKQSGGVTDEVLMLESSRPEKPPRPSRPSQPRPDPGFGSSANSSRDHSPAVPSRLHESFNQNLPPRPRSQAPASTRNGLSRFAAEEQASQAYVSSARRRKPQSTLTPDLEPELLGETSTSVTSNRPQVTPPASKPKASTPIVTRPPPPTRTIPAVSAISLKASHSDREAGNEHFKRGDYASAHASYSKALSHLPKTHPITVILLTNRALTGLKTGEPKTAIIDSNAAILLIGVSKGESEKVDLNNGEAPKPMRDYYGKALMRKAEALEHMEKWSDAAAVWREAVESGHGGATAIQGRMRAEKAANPEVSKPKLAPAQKPAATVRSKQAISAGAAAEAAAISRLRAQNAAADKLDDERFALSDAVDAKLTAWKGGKQDNLRALLGSLDTVLWAEAGWKKISMADLVLPNKVKIQYMKGIAKVHPDKIPTDASTEQRMIAGAVFSTLNEAWDKFKKENGL